MTGLVIMFVAIWVLGAMLALKMDSMLTDCPTDYDLFGVILSLFLWPVIAYFLLTTKHRVGMYVYGWKDGKKTVEVFCERFCY